MIKHQYINQLKKENHTIISLDESKSLLLTDTCSLEKEYIDTEEAEVRTVNINNMEGILISKDDRNILCWHNDKIFFSMTSYIEENEMIEIAKKIKKIS